MKFLVVPLKKSPEIDVGNPLRNLLKGSSTNAANPDDHTPLEFGKLRNVAVNKFNEKNEHSLQTIYGYYDQLTSLEFKIPAGELQVPFKWKDAFDKGSFFGGKISLTHASLSYEKVCILFNIAAMQCNLAATKILESDEGLKSAIKYFQQAAGIFELVKSQTPSALPVEPTPDLKQDTLTLLISLMLAQAQELFIFKAIRDKLKEGVIAKLCYECSQLYSDLLEGMQKENVRTIFAEKDWISIISAKQVGYLGMMQLFQSIVCRTSKKIGEEIARLQGAIQHFNASQSRFSEDGYFNEYQATAQRHLTESIKDNDFIYNEIIPDINTLSMPDRVLLAKPLKMTSPFSENFKDMFAEYIPLTVYQAISASESRKNDAINAEVMKLREATNNLNELLASMNLPAAVEVDQSGCGLPPSILTKSEDVKSRGGISSLDNLVKELPELLTRNSEILDESERMLVEEQKSDDSLRSQFKERWTRVPSEKLTAMFFSNARKYRDIINNAIEADKIVREKYDKNRPGVQLLSDSAEKLKEAIPLCGEVQTTNNPSVQQLRQLMRSVESLKTSRDSLETELKAVKIDVKDLFLRTFSKDGSINEPALSLPEIHAATENLRKRVQDSLQEQQTLIGNIREAHSAFTAGHGNNNASRDNVLSELAKAYDNYIELQNNLKEGIKFYNDLTQLLVAFQNKISDFCFARKTEKEELLRDLTQESSRPPAAVMPTNPADTGNNSGNYHGTLPYPTQAGNMPMPVGSMNMASHTAFVGPPMPQSFNPYASLPYPTTAYNYAGFPQGPPANQNYGTYPGGYQHQQQGGYPFQNQKPPGW